jgi:hypothetical protein
LSQKYESKQVNAGINLFVSSARGFFFLLPDSLSEAAGISNVFDKTALVRFKLSFNAVKLPMWGRVMSKPLFLFGENLSKIQGSMLYFEPERAHKFEPST